MVAPMTSSHSSSPTSSPTSEVPFFRGKTLTPESPVPVHIPEPANIPVLQNQIDPIFNLMSTHVDQPSSSRGQGTTGSSLPTSIIPDVTLGPTALGASDAKPNETNYQEEQDYDGDGDNDYIMDLENEELPDSDTLTNHSSSLIQPSTDAAPHETHSVPTQNYLSLSSHGQPQDTDLSLSSHGQPQENDPSLSSHGQPRDISLSSHGQPQEHDPSLSSHGQPQDIAGVPLQHSKSPHEPTQSPSASIGQNATTTDSHGESNTHVQTVDNESPLAALPVPAGLPPRPPPQEKPAIHPNYTPGEDIRTYHYTHTQNSNTHTSYSSQPSNPYRPSQGYPHPATNATVGANGLPPPPIATFQQPPAKATQGSPTAQQPRPNEVQGRNGERSAVSADEGEDDVPWDQEVARKYAEFLRDEAVYVTEGLWDRFPQGSRLFVGNLYTEKVTKRDLFYVFHKYGRLAQVSIKNAYGFIQYLDSACCLRALQAEQGQAIRGRKLHLEISKPQKNSRNAAATAAGDSLRAGYNNRRSRSPDYGGRGSVQRGSNPRGGVDRGVTNNNFRDEPPRRRDDYRPGRSPSPRGYRGRDEYRGWDRSPDRYFGNRRSRSRSPYNRNGRYRSRSPRPRDVDDEADLPLLRRDPRDVPDVQIILVDEVDRTFVAYIEKSFRERGLRCDSLKLPRVSLTAVVKRQIIEGVQAVVKIFRQSQVTGKIPLQVFDRRGGVDNVRFEEYDELDANIAAELVVREKALHQAPTAGPTPGPGPGPGPYGMAPVYGVPQYGQNPQHLPSQQPQPQSNGAAPNLTNLITSMDGPALQKLLGAITQNPQTPQNPQPPNPQQGVQVPDLAALLGNVARQQQQQPLPQGYPYAGQQQQHAQPNPYGAPAPNSSFANNAALASLLASAGQAGNRPYQGVQNHEQQIQPSHQHHVQNVMQQLARWKQ